MAGLSEARSPRAVFFSGDGKGLVMRNDGLQGSEDSGEQRKACALLV